jgi:response regulator RpfG family c-di-GMP phosphodiesterase
VQISSTSRASSPSHRAQEDLRLLEDSVVDLLARLLHEGHDAGLERRGRLAAWAGRAAADLGLDPGEQRMVSVAVRLHDVSRLGPATDRGGRRWPPGPEDGWGVLRRLPGLERAALLVLHHRERFDGGGHPGALRGEEIPLGSRIVAVARAAEALLRSGNRFADLAPAGLARHLQAAAGAALDPRVVEAFARTAEVPSARTEAPLAVAV